MSLYSGESLTSCSGMPPLPILPPAVMHCGSQRASNSNPLCRGSFQRQRNMNRVSFCPSSGVQRPGNMTVLEPTVCLLPEGSALAQGEALSYVRTLTLVPALCVSISLCLRGSMVQRELREGHLGLRGGSQGDKGALPPLQTLLVYATLLLLSCPLTEPLAMVPLEKCTRDW